jgi:hypothetical protein
MHAKLVEAVADADTRNSTVIGQHIKYKSVNEFTASYRSTHLVLQSFNLRQFVDLQFVGCFHRS